MTQSPEALLGEFVDRYFAGYSPSPLKFIERAGDQADYLAALIDDFLSLTPPVEPNEAAVERALETHPALIYAKLEHPGAGRALSQERHERGVPDEAQSHLAEAAESAPEREGSPGPLQRLRDEWLTSSRGALQRLAESLVAANSGIALAQTAHSRSRGAFRSADRYRLPLDREGANVDLSPDGILELSITGLAAQAGDDVIIAIPTGREDEDSEDSTIEWAQLPAGLLTASVTANGSARVRIGRLKDPQADLSHLLSAVYLFWDE